MEQYKLERGTVALPFYVTLNGQTVATFSNEDDANTFLEIKNAVQENTEPKKITVEAACSLSSMGKAIADVKAEAFKKILMCADWANDGEPPSPKNNFDYVRVWYDLLEKKFASSINNDVMSFPFYFKSKEAYEKFMAIDGIEPLLHTFLNTGK